MADKKARDIMSDDCTCIGEADTVLDAAKQLALLNVGSMPICGEDDRLKRCHRPRHRREGARRGQGPVERDRRRARRRRRQAVTIGADDSIDDALRTMIDHKVRRLPVIDDRKLVGIISQADIATNLDEEKVGDRSRRFRRAVGRPSAGGA